MWSITHWYMGHRLIFMWKMTHSHDAFLCMWDMIHSCVCHMWVVTYVCQFSRADALCICLCKDAWEGGSKMSKDKKKMKERAKESERERANEREWVRGWNVGMVERYTGTEEENPRETKRQRNHKISHVTKQKDREITKSLMLLLWWNWFERLSSRFSPDGWGGW